MPQVVDLNGWTLPRKMLAALAGGAITGLGQAPFSLLLFALIGLLIGFLLFGSTKNNKQATWVGWAFGLGYFALVLNWIIEPFLVDIARHGWMAPFALIGLSGGMALFWGLAFYLARRLNSPLALVVFWTGTEVLRSIILTGFPWGLLGYIWLDFGLDQMASVIGPHGLTLLTLFGVWGLFASFSICGHKRILSLLAVLSFGCSLYIGTVFMSVNAAFDSIGASICKHGECSRPVVRLIQTNAPQHEKWDTQMIPVFFERNMQFTAATPAGRKPDLIIWPETAVPYLLNRADGVLSLISDAAGDVPVVLGIQRKGDSTYHNSLLVMGANGVVDDVYDKSHLVPFGEYMPGGGLAAALGLNGLAPQGGYGFGPGDGLRLIEIEGLGRALPLICYEAIFPEEVGGLDARADWMLHITNDAWFGNLTGPQQHLAQTRFRAIEQGLPMVRAANTGISAMIDARGQILASLGLGKAGFLDVELPRALPPTVYARTGDMPIYLLLIVMALILSLKSRRHSG